MKLNVSCADFYQEVSDEVVLESTGIFRHLMDNFSPQLLGLQAAGTNELRKEAARVRAEADRVPQKQPMSRREDRA